MIQPQVSSNLDDINKELERLADRGEDLAPALAEIAELLQNTVEEAFEQKSDPVTGTPWQDLSPVTVARKEKKGYADPDRPLFAAGDMQESLSSESSRFNAVVGFNAKSVKGYPYPAVHQYGTKDGKVKARPMLPIDGQGNLARHVEDEILEIFEEHFTL